MGMSLGLVVVSGTGCFGIGRGTGLAGAARRAGSLRARAGGGLRVAGLALHGLGGLGAGGLGGGSVDSSGSGEPGADGAAANTNY